MASVRRILLATLDQAVECDNRAAVNVRSQP